MVKPALFVSAALVAITPLAAEAILPLVQTGSGGCPSGYVSAVNVNSTHVCVLHFDPDPEVFVSDSPCPTGYVSVGSGIAGQWICAST